MNRSLSLARSNFEQVLHRTTNPAADRLYRSLGFEDVNDLTATHELRSKPSEDPGPEP